MLLLKHDDSDAFEILARGFEYKANFSCLGIRSARPAGLLFVGEAAASSLGNLDNNDESSL